MSQYRYPPDYDREQTDLAVRRLGEDVKVFGNLHQFVGTEMSPLNVTAIQIAMNAAADEAERSFGSYLPGYIPVIRAVSDGSTLIALTLWEPV